MRQIDVTAVSMVSRAILTLAGQCDGARSHDGVGFSRFDCEFGFSLADSIAKWGRLTPKQHTAAQRLCVKYAKQLIAAGFNLNDLMVEEPPEAAEKKAPTMKRFIAEVVKETDKAVQVLINGASYWMPKSQAHIEGAEIVLPEWLAAKKGL
jgi:hypothetical protein